MIQDVFSVLADPTRRAILEALRDGERPVGDLVEEVGVSQPTVSKHLRILREAAVVEQRAEGQKRFYTLCPEGLEPALQWLSTLSGKAPTATTGTTTPDAPRVVVGSEAGVRTGEVVDPVAAEVELASAGAPVQAKAEASRGGFLSNVFRRRRR